MANYVADAQVHRVFFCVVSLQRKCCPGGTLDAQDTKMEGVTLHGEQCVDQKSSPSRASLCVKLTRVGSAIILNDFYATGPAYHKANGALTKLSLFQNKIGDTGAIALADALKATFAMCFSSGVASTFFWPSLTQCPDDNHPLSLAQARSTLMCVNWTSCVQRVRCGVRCDSSSLHRAFANMHIQVSCMDVLRAILVGAAIILRRGAFLVHTEQGISYVALTVNTCLLACLQKKAATRHKATGRISQDTT